MIQSAILRFDKLMHRTDKAILIRIGSTEHWLPIRLCRNLVVNSKLGGNVSIPTWKYQEITGIEPTAEDADYIVTKHKPERREPVQNLQPHQSLLK